MGALGTNELKAFTNNYAETFRRYASILINPLYRFKNITINCGN